MNKNIFAKNKNLNFDLHYYNRYGVPYVSFRPYDREITLRYIETWLKRLLKEYDKLVIYAQGFAFDGLSETNKDLIKDGCIITNLLTGEYKTFKGV